MKRLALILALLSLPATTGAATWWVSYPQRAIHPGNNSNAGTDSLAPKTLSWAMDDTLVSGIRAGDVIRLMPGTHPYPIMPMATGNAGARLRFIGSITGGDPENYAVQYVCLDSIAESAGGFKRLLEYVTVWGVQANYLNIRYSGGVTARGTHAEATSVHDSIAYCRFLNGASLRTVSDVSITSCVIGEGKKDDKWSVGDSGIKPCWYFDPCHCPVNHCNAADCGAPYYEYVAHQALPNTSADSAWWSTRLNITDNTFNLNSSGGTGAMQMSWIKTSVYSRNRHQIVLDGPKEDFHFNTWYNLQDSEINDNLWVCRVVQARPGARYGLNLRDNQVANRWARDTVYQHMKSFAPVKVEFMTSGASPNTSHNNSYNGMVIIVGGAIGYQHRSKGDSHKFGVYFSGGPSGYESFATTFTPGFQFSNLSSTDTSTVDSLVFYHNTVVSAHYTIAQSDGQRMRHSTIKKNIFMSNGAYPRGTWQTGLLKYNSTAVGLVDSNLVWCPVPDDSLYAIDYGGSSIRYPLRWTAAGAASPWAGTYGNDVGSHWGTPAFTDSVWRRRFFETGNDDSMTFDPTPTQYSLAASSNLWGADGYVGAKAGTGADTERPTVTLLLPSPLTALAPYGITDVQWLATDNVSVASVAIAYSTNGTTWTDILTGQSASGTYQWQYPNFHWSRFYLRATVVDGGGLTNTNTITVPFLCSSCNDALPENDPNRIPD